MEGLDEETCLRRFRFTSPEIRRLYDALHVFPNYTAPCRTSWTGMEGLLVLLRRLTWPSRLGDLCEEFGRSTAVLSTIFNHMLSWLCETWGDVITNPFEKPFFTQERVASYRATIEREAGVDLDLWGFIDGTCRRICRPDNDQREFYTGHKRCHAVKYQGVATPDGLIICLHGPYEGKRHDAGVFARSGLCTQLEQHMNMPGGGAYALYGDAAYPLSVYLQKGYRVMTKNWDKI